MGIVFQLPLVVLFGVLGTAIVGLAVAVWLLALLNAELKRSEAQNLALAAMQAEQTEPILAFKLAREAARLEPSRTNIERLKQGVAIGAASSMVLKITQVGSVTEAMEACRYCVTHGYNVHPCGSRGDREGIGDFAVGLNAGQVRAAGHNRLLTIERELGDAALWQGKAAYKGWRHREEGN